MSTTSNNKAFTAVRTVREDGPLIAAAVKKRVSSLKGKRDKVSGSSKPMTTGGKSSKTDDTERKTHFSWLGTPITAKQKAAEDQVMQEEDEAEDECCLCGEMAPWQEMIVVMNQGRTCADCVRVDETDQKPKTKGASSIKTSKVSSTKTNSLPKPAPTAKRVVKPRLVSVKKAVPVKAPTPKKKASAKVMKIKTDVVETKSKTPNGSKGTKSEYQVRLEAAQQSRRERAKLREAQKHATCYMCSDEGHFTRMFMGEVLCAPCSDHAHDDLANKRWSTCGQCKCQIVASMAYGKDMLCTDCNTKDYERRHGATRAIQAAFNKLEDVRETKAKTKNVKKPKQTTKAKASIKDGKKDKEMPDVKNNQGKEEKETETEDEDMQFEPMDFPPGINANRILPPRSRQQIRLDIVECEYCERKIDLQIDTVTFRRVNADGHYFCTDECSDLFVKNTKELEPREAKVKSMPADQDNGMDSPKEKIDCFYCGDEVLKTKAYSDPKNKGRDFCCEGCCDMSRKADQSALEDEKMVKNWLSEIEKIPRDAKLICNQCIKEFPKNQVVATDKICGVYFCSLTCANLYSCRHEDKMENTYTKAPKTKEPRTKPYSRRFVTHKFHRVVG